MTPWETLGVAQDVAVADLRRRYAALIKVFRPETHPQDFARIREAYEGVLPFARRREAAARDEVAEPIADHVVDAMPVEPPTDPSPPADDGASDVHEHEHEHEIDVTADADAAIPVLLGAPHVEPDAGEPDLATRFQRFHAHAKAALGTRDEAFLPELRTLLQSRASASLDDSQALEFALLRWFIETDQPPLTLLFESGRTFDWHQHPARLSGWLSAWALRQMEARLALSRDLVWARHFSGNAWLRRLHSPRPAVTPIALRPAAVDALRWAERWALACETADTPALAAGLDPRTLRRLQGRQLMTTDLLTGLALACAAPGLVDAAVYAAIGTALTFALRQALRWLHPAPGQWRLPGPIARGVAREPGWAIVLAVGLAGVGFILLAVDDTNGEDSRAFALPLIAPAALIGVLAIRRVLAWLELVVAEAFAWRDAVDRLEFDGFLRGRTPATPAAPFGTRLPPRQRWKAIPAALRFRKIEMATRARPVQPPVIKWARVTWARPSAGRLVWIALWVLFAIARAIHAFGN